jgi:hypothetical protein
MLRAWIGWLPPHNQCKPLITGNLINFPYCELLLISILVEISRHAKQKFAPYVTLQFQNSCNSCAVAAHIHHIPRSPRCLKHRPDVRYRRQQRHLTIAVPSADDHQRLSREHCRASRTSRPNLIPILSASPSHGVYQRWLPRVFGISTELLSEL